MALGLSAASRFVSSILFSNKLVFSSRALLFGGMRRRVLMCILSVRPRVIDHGFALVDKRVDVDDGVIAFRDYSLLTEKVILEPL